MLFLQLILSFVYAQSPDCTEMERPVTEQCFFTYQDQFENFYPQLRFRFLWQEDQPQAFASGNLVVLTGGFARKKDLTQGGFLTVLCHEVGHAGFGFHEGEADDFAARFCIPKYIDTHLENAPIESPKTVQSFCEQQDELSPDQCELSVSMLYNAANADRSRCLKNLKGLEAQTISQWNLQGFVPNQYHRCLLTSQRYPIIGDLLTDVVDEVISIIEEPVSLFNKDQRQVSQEYSRHNSPQCRMDTLLAGALDLDRPRCWSL